MSPPVQSAITFLITYLLSVEKVPPFVKASGANMHVALKYLVLGVRKNQED